MAGRTLDPADLPPRPDPVSGQPRPPHAPDSRPYGASEPLADLPGLAPPPGQGPVLAILMPDLLGLKIAISVLYGVGGFAALIVLVLVVHGQMTIVGVVITVGVLLIVGGGARLGLRWASDRVAAAGADWYSVDTRWVRTYELISVTMSGPLGNVDLILTDSANRTVRVKYNDIRTEQLIWDLVYNGILHSVVTGHATANRFAANRLGLSRTG